LHQNSLLIARRLLAAHLRTSDAIIYDVGSCDVNGTLRPMIERYSRKYVGLDIIAGPNVDIVVPERGEWSLLQCDFAISCNTLEHVKRPWEWIEQIADCLKPHGRVMIVVPRHLGDHRFPVDCWRVLPDGMESLLDYGGFRVLEVGTFKADTFGVGELQ
jgi:SAM-dependent methyltransferase